MAFVASQGKGKRSFWGRRRAFIFPLAGLVVLIGVWELVVIAANPFPTVLPSPVVVMNALADLLTRSEFWADVAISLRRVGSGLLLALITGLPLGALLGESKGLTRLVQPTLNALRFIIPFAWIPLVSVIFGLGEGGKIFITWYAGFFVIVFNSSEGIRSVPPALVRVAETLGATRMQISLRVRAPAALPVVLTGVRLALGLSWIALLAAELVRANSGLGYYILTEASLLRMPYVLAGMIVIGVIGFLLNGTLRLVESRIVRS